MSLPKRSHRHHGLNPPQPQSDFTFESPDPLRQNYHYTYHNNSFIGSRVNTYSLIPKVSYQQMISTSPNHSQTHSTITSPSLSDLSTEDTKEEKHKNKFNFLFPSNFKLQTSNFIQSITHIHVLLINARIKHHIIHNSSLNNPNISLSRS